MKQNTFIYAIFTIVCSLFIVSSCSQEENIENALQPKEFIINITDAGIHNAKTHVQQNSVIQQLSSTVIK